MKYLCRFNILKKRKNVREKQRRRFIKKESQTRNKIVLYFLNLFPSMTSFLPKETFVESYPFDKENDSFQSWKQMDMVEIMKRNEEKKHFYLNVGCIMLIMYKC